MSPSRSTLLRRSAPVPAVGSVEGEGNPQVTGHLRQHELLALLGSVAYWSIERHTPLQTCTIIRTEACDIEISSSTSR